VTIRARTAKDAREAHVLVRERLHLRTDLHLGKTGGKVEMRDARLGRYDGEEFVYGGESAGRDHLRALLLGIGHIATHGLLFLTERDVGCGVKKILDLGDAFDPRDPSLVRRLVDHLG